MQESSQIFVSYLGKRIALDVTREELTQEELTQEKTVLLIKKKIFEKEGFPIYRQNINGIGKSGSMFLYIMRPQQPLENVYANSS